MQTILRQHQGLQIHIFYFFTNFMILLIVNIRQVFRAMAPALKVCIQIIQPARELLQWEGVRLFEPSAGFFYGNSCNSGTESRKIVSKVGN